MFSFVNEKGREELLERLVPGYSPGNAWTFPTGIMKNYIAVLGS
jgi:hypothetical protein